MKGLAMALAVVLFASAAEARPKVMKPEAQGHYTRGLTLYKGKHYDEAISEFKLGYEIDPRPEFLYALAQAERKNGNCGAAIEHYRALLATNPPEQQATAV